MAWEELLVSVGLPTEGLAGPAAILVLVTVVADLVTVVGASVTMTEVTTTLEVPAARFERTASVGAASAGGVDERADRIVLLRIWPGMSRVELSESGIDTTAYTARPMATQRTNIWTRIYGRRRARGLYERAGRAARPFSKMSSSSRTAWALYAYALIEGATTCLISAGKADGRVKPCPRMVDSREQLGRVVWEDGG